MGRGGGAGGGSHGGASHGGASRGGASHGGGGFSSGGGRGFSSGGSSGLSGGSTHRGGSIPGGSTQRGGSMPGGSTQRGSMPGGSTQRGGYTGGSQRPSGNSGRAGGSQRPPGGGTPPRQPSRNRSGSFGSGFGVGMMVGSAMNRQSRRRRAYGNSGGNGGGNGGGSPQRDNRNGQRRMLIPILIIVILVVMLIGCLAAIRSGSNNSYEGDGITRTPLDASQCIESSEWLDDELGWISNQSTVTKGMSDFYERTGVQPYLIITDNIEGEGANLTDSAAESYLEDVYTSLYDDEGHLIFAFVEYLPGFYRTYLYVGTAASGVIDSSARDIMLGVADRLYTDDSLSDDAYFAEIFSESGQTLMQDYTQQHRTRNTVLIILVVGAVLIVLLLVARQLAVARTKQAEKTKEILDTPLGQSPEDEELERKYGDHSGGIS